MTAGLSLEDFVKNPVLVRATERGIEIMGKAARRVSTAFHQAQPAIPGGQIIGQRNLLAHEYGRIDYELLFKTDAEDTPQLIQDLEPLLPCLEASWTATIMQNPWNYRKEVRDNRVRTPTALAGVRLPGLCQPGQGQSGYLLAQGRVPGGLREPSCTGCDRLRDRGGPGGRPGAVSRHLRRPEGEWVTWRCSNTQPNPRLPAPTTSGKVVCYPFCLKDDLGKSNSGAAQRCCEGRDVRVEITERVPCMFVWSFLIRPLSHRGTRGRSRLHSATRWCGYLD